MHKLLLVLLCSTLLAACNFLDKNTSSTQNLVDGTFRVQYYNINQPEKLLDGGERERISFGYIHSVKDIDGEKLGVLWQGKIRQPATGTVTIQHSNADKLQVEIDGKPIKLAHGGYTDVHLEKGSHSVQVRYEPKWSGGDMAVNFFSDRPRAPESVAQDVQAAAKNADVAFAQVQAKMDNIAIHPKDWQWQDAQLFVPATTKPQILVLSAQNLSNVNLTLHDDAEIAAIVALNGVGHIAGSNAPVYRVARQIDDDWWPVNCRCSGGTNLHCSGDTEHGFPEIQALSQTLFGKEPSAYALQSTWHSATNMAHYHKQAIAKYEQDKAKCGGSQAIRFDNAMNPNQPTHTNDAGSLHNFGTDEQSWLSKMGGSLPERGFDAYYFTHDGIGKPIAQENVPHIALNYPYKEFHNIDAQQFAALWAGYLHANEDTAMAMQYDISWAQMRVWLNGKKVFEHRHGENGKPQEGSFDLIVPKGKNRLEVEYINHWHTVGFALHPQPKILVYPQPDEMQQLLNNPNYDVVYAKVYESGNRDSSLPITLPASSKPIVLILDSHNSVFWQIQPRAGSLHTIIIQDGKGVVSGSKARVWRAKQLPHTRKATWRFNQYDPEQIDATQFKQ